MSLSYGKKQVKKYMFLHSNYMAKEKLRIFMNAFFNSQFRSYPLVSMFHSQTLNNMKNKLQERALHLIYHDSSPFFTKVLEKGCYCCIGI